MSPTPFDWSKLIADLTDETSGLPPDVVFQIAENDQVHEIKLHKTILAMISPFFKTMIAQDNTAKVFMIEKTTAQAFQIIKDAIYNKKSIGDSLQGKSVDEVFQVVEIIERFQIKELTEVMNEYLANFLNKDETVLEVAEEAMEFKAVSKTVRIHGNTQKSITEELEEVLNFLKSGQIMRDEDLNVIKKPLDNLKSFLKYIPLGQDFNFLPAEIKMNIFSYLDDLNALTAASVCQEWEGILRDSWGGVEKILSGPRDLRDVDLGALARAMTEVEHLSIEWHSKLTREQNAALFAHLARQVTKLKKLTFLDHDMSLVKTDDLATVVNKLEEVEIRDANLSAPQINGILRHIVENETKLKKLMLAKLYDIIVVHGVEQDLLTRARNKLSQSGGHISLSQWSFY